ncbi:MAG TPA: hypothetical protein VFB01_17765 [Burkholderiales bacterium]|jgi:hypothetical protein|nr:hypothetical protein [Burkholderiales bacterium]
MRKVSLIVLVLAACAEPAAAFLCQGIYGPEIPSVGRFILDSPIEIKGVVRKRITFSERGFIFAGDDPNPCTSKPLLERDVFKKGHATGFVVVAHLKCGKTKGTARAFVASGNDVQTSDAEDCKTISGVLKLGRKKIKFSGKRTRCGDGVVDPFPITNTGFKHALEDCEPPGDAKLTGDCDQDCQFATCLTGRTVTENDCFNTFHGTAYYRPMWVLTSFPPGLLTSIPPGGALLRDGLASAGSLSPGASVCRM